MANDLSDIRNLIGTTIRGAMMDDGLFRPKSGGADVPVRVKLTHPTEATVLQGSSIVKSRPVIEVYLSDVAALTVGDCFIHAGLIWRVAAAPLRPGSGMKWRAEVEQTGTA